MLLKLMRLYAMLLAEVEAVAASCSIFCSILASYITYKAMLLAEVDTVAAACGILLHLEVIRREP